MTSTEFVVWLERLLATPLPSQAEVEGWYARQTPFLDRLDDVPDLDPDFFHFVHHYLSDVDVRCGDRDYRNEQDAALRRYLAAYRARIGTQVP
jgi:hypothetical protein